MPAPARKTGDQTFLRPPLVNEKTGAQWLHKPAHTRRGQTRPKKQALLSSPAPLLQNPCPVSPRRAADTYQQEAGLLQVGERHGSLPHRVRSGRLRGPLQGQRQSLNDEVIAALHGAQARPGLCRALRTCSPVASSRARTAGRACGKAGHRPRARPGSGGSASAPLLLLGPGRQDSKASPARVPSPVVQMLFERGFTDSLKSQV